jgi:hypothetical protein
MFTPEERQDLERLLSKLTQFSTIREHAADDDHAYYLQGLLVRCKNNLNS